jgi:hypothetical protein
MKIVVFINVKVALLVAPDEEEEGKFKAISFAGPESTANIFTHFYTDFRASLSELGCFHVGIDKIKG